MVWSALGQSGQRTFVKCAEAEWNYQVRGHNALKIIWFFCLFVCFCFVFVLFLFCCCCFCVCFLFTEKKERSSLKMVEVFFLFIFLLVEVHFTFLLLLLLLSLFLLLLLFVFFSFGNPPSANGLSMIHIGCCCAKVPIDICSSILVPVPR